MHIVVQVSTHREWDALLACLPSQPAIDETPVGPSAHYQWQLPSRTVTTTLLRGGMGKINAAASAQFALLVWKPALFLLLGAAGAVDPSLTELSLIVATRTIVYDFEPTSIEEAQTLIAAHTSDLSHAWDLQAFPFLTYAGLIATGDRDVTQTHAHLLYSRFAALVADWESGAVAKVCRMNQTPCVILRGVTDSAYIAATEQFARYTDNTPIVMERLWQTLPVCLEQYVSVLARGAPA